jgi:hypothetical protein
VPRARGLGLAAAPRSPCVNGSDGSSAPKSASGSLRDMCAAAERFRPSNRRGKSFLTVGAAGAGSAGGHRTHVGLRDRLCGLCADGLPLRRRQLPRGMCALRVDPLRGTAERGSLRHHPQTVSFQSIISEAAHQKKKVRRWRAVVRAARVDHVRACLCLCVCSPCRRWRRVRGAVSNLSGSPAAAVLTHARALRVCGSESQADAVGREDRAELAQAPG